MIYEDRYPPLVASVIERSAHCGWRGDDRGPGPPDDGAVLRAAARLGLKLRGTEMVKYDEEPAGQTIQLHTIVRDD